MPGLACPAICMNWIFARYQSPIVLQVFVNCAPPDLAGASQTLEFERQAILWGNTAEENKGRL